MMRAAFLYGVSRSRTLSLQRAGGLRISPLSPTVSAQSIVISSILIKILQDGGWYQSTNSSIKRTAPLESRTT